MKFFNQSTAALFIGFISVVSTSCKNTNQQVSDGELGFEYEILAEGFEIPWSIEVIDENEFLFTERMGALLHYKNGEVSKVSGLPESRTFTTDRPYGGMMDVSLHPQFNSNRLVYLAFVNESYTLSVAKFNLVEERAENLEVIITTNQFSIGSRIAWQDEEHFFLTSGVGGAPKPEPGPQDIADARGKIFRFKADGSIPEDNPIFSGFSEPSPVWTYGHRDPQGLFYDTDSSVLYANEHGPLGGDELNIIVKGGNYGWPIFSFGMNYDRTKVSEMTEAEAAENTILPVKYWLPEDFGYNNAEWGYTYQLAPSALLKLKNSSFEEWNGSFLMAGLTFQNLLRYNLETDESEIVWPRAGRIRDIAQLPSGNLVLLIDKNSPNRSDDGRLVRISPRKKE